MLASIVFLAKASHIGSPAEADACQQDSDDLSLIQAQHRAAFEKGGPAAQDDRVSKEVPQGSQPPRSRPLLSLLTLSPSTAAVVGPEAAAAVVEASAAAEPSVPFAPMRMAVWLSQKSIAAAERILADFAKRMSERSDASLY